MSFQFVGCFVDETVGITEINCHCVKVCESEVMVKCENEVSVEGERERVLEPVRLEELCLQPRAVILLIVTSL